MKNSVVTQVTEQLYTHRKHHRWQVIVSCLASVVVFVTTYLLILPAITMETTPYCGYEEHIHTDSCYSCFTGTTAESTEAEPESTDLTDTESDSTTEETTFAETTTENSDIIIDSTEPTETTDEIESATSSACNHENCELVCGMMEHTHVDTCFNQTHKVVLSVRYEDTMETDWKFNITAKHNDKLSDLMKDVDTLPNGKTAIEAKWYNAQNDEEVSLDDAVLHNLELYSIYALEDIKKPSDGAAEPDAADVSEAATNGEADNTTEKVTVEETTEPEKQQQTVPLEDTFTYKDDNFIIRLNISGEALLPEADEALAEPETTSESTTAAEITDSATTETTDATSANEDTTELSELTSETAAVQPTEQASTEEQTSLPEPTTAADDGVIPVEADRKYLVPKVKRGSEKLVLSVKPIDDSDKAYSEIADYAENTSVADNTIAMEVLQFSLSYGNQELDLSDCKITAEITPNKSLINEAESLAQSASQDAETGVVITAYDKNEKNKVTNLESIYLTDNRDKDDETMFVDVNNGMIALYAGSTANPQFTVEYYAFIDRLDEATSSTDATKKLDIIDTSAAANGGSPKLPVNGVTPVTKHPYIDANNHVAVKSGVSNSWTKIFESENCEYIKTPNLNYFNKFYDSANYTLAQVKIQHNVNGKMVWHAFVGDFSKMHFTNRTETAAGTNWSKYNTWISLGGKGKENTTATTISTENNDIYILIENGTVIQLACLPTTGIYENKANFYDYDITDGYIYKAASATGTKYNTSTQKDNDGITWYANVTEQGINNPSNYNGKGTKFAFGNAATTVDTSLGELKWNGKNTPNRANANGYKNCTFGLVSKLDSNGNIVYADNLNVPNLFDEEGAPIGKTSYKDYSLDFNRSGDTYTLSMVKKGSNPVTGDLTSFISRDNWNKTIKLWSNDYWPMDTAESCGTDGHDLKFGKKSLLYKRMYFNSATPKSSNFPVYDFTDIHDIDRNAYFGMHYAVNFKLTEDYVGPLEYTFFGDDDMWVFLDGQLVCDIGGVHSSVGEYVDLWDYLQKGDAGTHKLDFYFTERGASGSTCWMHFTLPSVSTATPEQNTGDLRVEKDLRGSDATDMEFEFNIHFTDENGNHLTDDYAYSRYKADGTYIESDIIIWDGGKFRLRGGEYIIVKYLPDKTKYTISENVYNGFNTSVSIDGVVTDGNTATGQIDIKKTKQVLVSIINAAGFRLPATGGTGTQIYILSGLLLTTTALIYGYKLRRKRERRGGRKETPA
ncbi:MAG: fibro-slime domain-containing protein [Ruminococcus sp.]|nr:fibro-slime domain-containing protein [Ruminococcus sp.]